MIRSFHLAKISVVLLLMKETSTIKKSHVTSAGVSQRSFCTRALQTYVMLLCKKSIRSSVFTMEKSCSLSRPADRPTED